MIIGRIRDFTRDILTRKQLLTLEVEGDIVELIEQLKNEKLSIEIKKFRKKRSLTASRFYWQLVHKISELNGVSDAWTHNMYLRDCHCIARLEDGTPITVTVPDTEQAEIEVMNKTEYHLMPTSHTIEGKNGRLRHYIMLRGSSSFDSAEMARLIDFAVQDAKQLGIETITETEKQKLIELYGVSRNEKITDKKSS